MNRKFINRNRQKGAVLAVCMIVLLVLTLLSLSGARSVILQEKMTFASRDAQIALQAAEAGLRAAEGNIFALTSLGQTAQMKGYYGSQPPTDLFNDSSWSNAETSTVTMNDQSLTYRYFVVYMGELGFPNDVQDGGGTKGDKQPPHVFRVVSRGQGLNTERILISYFSKKF